MRVENIGEPGVRRRRRGAYLWTALAVAAIAVLTLTHAPRYYRLLVAIPIGLAAVGFLQAREKTWVVHAALGQREVYERGASTELSKGERRVARRQATSIALRSVLIAALAAVIAWVV